jgi:hypothetical protein
MRVATKRIRAMEDGVGYHRRRNTLAQTARRRRRRRKRKSEVLP